MKFTVEYVDQEGAVHEATVTANDEDDALDVFAERRPHLTATIAYPKEAK